MISVCNLVAGVDFGASGAITVLDRGDGSLVDLCLFDKMDFIGVNNFIEHYKEAIFCVEDVKPAFGDGAKQAFSFGKNVGLVEAFLEINKVVLHKVSPQMWVGYYRNKYPKYFNLSAGYKDNKHRNEAIVQYEYDDILKPYKKRTRYHSGLVDSFLIANFYRMNTKKVVDNTYKKELPKFKNKAPKARFI